MSGIGAGRTRIDDPDLSELLEGIDSGRVALPNFQRDFDWSDSDVRALLATVLNGWPMGSLLLIDGDARSKDFYAPRAFEFAPSLQNVPETIVLDGQQRLTSLYTALYQKSDLVYAVSISDDVEWDQIDSIDAAMRTFHRRVWDVKYPSAPLQLSERLLPISALKSAGEFYAWRDATGASERETLRITELYRERLSGLHRFRVPALRIAPDMPPPAVARIFERVNKTGQRLGVFDLMVAKTFSPAFNLRDKWDRACVDYPRLARFYGDDGTAPLQLIAIRSIGDVRSSAVLKLSALAVQDGWDRAVSSLDAGLDFAERRLGVVHSEWLPYGSLAVILGALAWDVPLAETDSNLESWFWRSVFSGRYAVGSNTTAVSDFNLLRGGARFQAAFSIDRSVLLESTRRSNGALHRAWLCALAAEYVESRGASLREADLGARSVLRASGGVESAHLLSLGFCLTVNKEFPECGPFLDPPAIPTGQPESVTSFLDARARRLVARLSRVCESEVRLSEVEPSAEGPIG